MLWAILVFHVSARWQIGAVPPKARTQRRAEFLAQPTTPYPATPTIYTRHSISFKMNQSHKPVQIFEHFFVFAPQKRTKTPELVRFEFNQIAASHKPGNMFACTVRLSRWRYMNRTPSASIRAHANLTSYRRQQDPHQQGPIWTSCLLGSFSVRA